MRGLHGPVIDGTPEPGGMSQIVPAAQAGGIRMTLTAEDRESVQADLDDERARLQRLQDVEPLKGLEGVRRAAVAAREKYIARLERMLEDG